MPTNKSAMWFGNTLTALGILMFLLGIGAFAFQSFRWLRDGMWTPLEIGFLLRVLGAKDPGIAWQGAHTLTHWILSCPLSVGMIAMGILITWLGVFVIETHQPKSYC